MLRPKVTRNVERIDKVEDGASEECSKEEKRHQKLPRNTKAPAFIKQ